MTFGPADPDNATAARLWELVAEARRQATAGLPRHRRAWVAVNPGSLLASRAVAGRLAGRARGRARGWLRDLATYLVSGYHERHDRSTPGPAGYGRGAGSPG